MNFELGNDNSVVLLQPEHLQDRSSKVKCTKSAVDARIDSVVEARGNIGKDSIDIHTKTGPAKKGLVECVISKQIELTISHISPEIAVDDDDDKSDLSNCDWSPSVLGDELAVEHHISASQIDSSLSNSGSHPSAGSFAQDDSLRDPSSGSFYYDYAETHLSPNIKQDLPKYDISNSHKQEPTLEDLMSIMEFECDPDCIEDVPYSESFHVQPTTPSFSMDSFRGRGRINNCHGSSSEFFPNSSIELAKSYANDEMLRSELGRNHGGNADKPNVKGNPELTAERKRKMSEVLDDETCTPNRPHPALEYPLLYFLLRRCQWLFDKIKIPYAYRWRLSYPLQQNVPLGVTLSKMGIYCTWGEFLLLMPFFASIVLCMMYTVVTPSVSVTGKVARFGLLSTLVFAQRNSLVTLLLGMPCDRGIFYHKLSGRVAGIASVLHTAAFFLDPKFQNAHGNGFCYGAFSGQINISGSIMMILVIAISISAMSQIRRRMYEVFYYLHVIFSTGLVVGAFFHSGTVVPIVAAATWGVDLFIRSIVMARTRYPRKATLKLVSDTVIELTFPKTTAFAYNPGQYVHIAIPEISWLQWHPFSISSSPKQRVVTLHIRIAGNWTKQLLELYKKQTEVSILLEGPYGNLSIDLMTDRKYKNVMLISGGIGSK
jgi:predicted ferric reductase